MITFYTWVFKKASRVRWMLNLYLPLLFSGIKVTELSDDFTYCRIELKNWFLTKNFNRSQYGGSLCSMTDPALSTMLYSILGKKYLVWDKSMSISFDEPGRKRVYCEFQLKLEDIEEILNKTANGDKYFFEQTVYIKDMAGKVIATATREIYIRLIRRHRPVGSGNK